MCPQSFDWFLYKERKIQRHREEGHLNTEAESGIMLLQVIECQRLSARIVRN